MSTLTAALENLVRDNPPMHLQPCSIPCSPGCCVGPSECTNVIISKRVGPLVLESLGSEWVDFGTFDNCREYGLTFSVPGWQFCVYEHRNSDQICIQGCRVEDIAGDYGPWPPDISKYDVISQSHYECYGDAAAKLIIILRHVNEHTDCTRGKLKLLVAGAFA